MSELELLDDALRVIEDVHGFSLCNYVLGVRHGGPEIDVVAYFKTRSGKERTVILELKETDLPKLIKQLISRKHLGNYVYGVIGLPPYEVVSWIDIDRVKQLGVGLISVNRCSVMLVKSKFHKVRIDDFQEETVL